MLNHIVIMGRLARDPELRRTQSGVPVASFRLATGEFVSRYFTKGRMAVVEGRLQMRDWTDKEGNKRTSAEVVADNVYFGDSRRDGDGSGYSPSYGGGQSSYSAPAPRSDPFGGYGAPPADGDQFAELSTDDGNLPF